VPFDPWPIDASAGAPAYSGQELRMGTVLPFMVGNGTSLSARSGVRPSGSLTDLKVEAQASPNMTVKVNPGVVVVQGTVSASTGPYTYALDAVKNLTIGAAHATLTRTDLILVRIRDASVDATGNRDGDVIVYAGTAGAGVPAMPVDATYFKLAEVTIAALDTAINSGDITDKRVFTAAAGGVVVCLSTAKPATPAPGQVIYCSDLPVSQRLQWWDESTWQILGGLPLIASTTLGSAAATVTFSNIPSTFKHLRIVAHAKASPNTAHEDILLRFNNDATAQYAFINITADNGGGSVGLLTGNTQTSMPIMRMASSNLNAAIFGGGFCDVLNYASTLAANKIAFSYSGSGDYGTVGQLRIRQGSWCPTSFTPAAVNRVDLISGSGNFVTGSRFEIYGFGS
jgi:hypothetical protein